MKNKNLNQHTADIDSNCSCVCVCVCVCISLSAAVLHNTAQNSSDNLPLILQKIMLLSTKEDKHIFTDGYMDN